MVVIWSPENFFLFFRRFQFFFFCFKKQCDFQRFCAYHIVPCHRTACTFVSLQSEQNHFRENSNKKENKENN